MLSSSPRRISPTSFYALQTKAPTDAQATAMMEKWLMSPDHFCVSDTGDFKGNNDTCYWGLPSIQASDPAFPPLGYWRGYGETAEREEREEREERARKREVHVARVRERDVCCVQLYTNTVSILLCRHLFDSVGTDGTVNSLVVAELRPRPGGAQGAQGAGETDGIAYDEPVGPASAHLRKLQPA